jgi:hypothetical protein
MYIIVIVVLFMIFAAIALVMVVENKITFADIFGKKTSAKSECGKK